LHVPNVGFTVSGHQSDLVAFGPRAIDFLPLARSGIFPGQLVVGEAGPEADLFVQHGTLVRRGERGTRRNWGSGTTDELLPLLELALATAPLGARMLPYSTTPALCALLSSLRPDVTLVAPNADLVSTLNDKACARMGLNRAGFPVPMYERVEPRDTSYSSLVRKLGAPFVVQTLTGSSGLSTWKVEGMDSWERLTRSLNPQPLLVSRVWGRCVLNLHLLVDDTNHIVSAPSIQLPGISELHAPWPVYCGNDFGAAARLPSTVLAAVEAFGARVARYLRKRGYLGLAGLDLALTEDQELAVLEINPRAQGSTWLLGELEWASGATPLLARLLGAEARSGTGLVGPEGAQLLMRNWRHDARWDIGALQDGLHSSHAGGLHRLGAAYGLADVRSTEVVLSGVPQAGMLIDRGAIVTRLATRDQIVETDGHTLTLRGLELSLAVNEAAKLKPSREDGPSEFS
jgi:hypothetical protein